MSIPPGRLPWDEALLAAVRKLEEQLRSCQAQNAELRVIIARQRKALYTAADRLENWKLRQEAWRTDRAELEARLRALS